jgi:hypothetical protein
MGDSKHISLMYLEAVPINLTWSALRSPAVSVYWFFIVLINTNRKFNAFHLVRCKADYRPTQRRLLPLNEELKTSDNNLYPGEGNSVLGAPNTKRERQEEIKVQQCHCSSDTVFITRKRKTSRIWSPSAMPHRLYIKDMLQTIAKWGNFSTAVCVWVCVWVCLSVYECAWVWLGATATFYTCNDYVHMCQI